MRYALRIGGWSHSLGNVMKLSGAYFPEFAVWLGWLRSLCRFFRIGSYRSHLIRMLSDHIDGLATLLRSFSAGFAKWRYETLHHCLESLLKLRVLCEQHLERCLFNEVKDDNELQTVIKACKQPQFWRWISVSYKLLYNRLEGLRRWGLLCPCCVEKRRNAPPLQENDTQLSVEFSTTTLCSR